MSSEISTSVCCISSPFVFRWAVEEVLLYFELASNTHWTPEELLRNGKCTYLAYYHHQVPLDADLWLMHLFHPPTADRYLCDSTSRVTLCVSFWFLMNQNDSDDCQLMMHILR